MIDASEITAYLHENPTVEVVNIGEPIVGDLIIPARPTPLHLFIPLVIGTIVAGGYRVKGYTGRMQSLDLHAKVRYYKKPGSPKHPKAIYATECDDSRFNVSVEGGEIGFSLEKGNGCSVTGSVKLRGIRREDTGQGYGFQMADCEDCEVAGIEVSGCRYGNSWTGRNVSNRVHTITGDVSVAHLDWHGGHYDGFVGENIPTVKEFNEVHATTKTESVFWHHCGFVAKSSADLPELKAYLNRIQGVAA